jgi:sugar (pentulose or hexulose) kinase
MDYLIGIDVGSSSTKVGAFDLTGDCLVAASRSYPTSEPRPGHKEQDPELWWSAVIECLREVNARVSPAEAIALGVTGHISSFTFVDSAGRPLRPSVSFQDQRAIRELGELYQRYSREDLAEQLGIDLPPAATWPLPKLLWFRKHEPGTLAGARCLLQAKDFINLRLTGAFASDASSSRGMVDLRRGVVAEPLFRELGLDSGLLPPLLQPEALIGRVTPGAACRSVLRPGLPVICGWNDLNACALGSGAVSAGDLFNVTGTSEHIGVVTNGHDSNPALVCAPFLDGRRLLYGVTMMGGGSLDWYRRISDREIQELLADAESAPAGSDWLLFLPYLEGERAPVWDPLASGAFVGLRTHHEQAHLIRAILEGVAYSLRQILDLVQQETSCISEAIRICGGAARVQVWNQIKADVLARPVLVTANAHAGVLGASMLAAVGAGCFGSCEEAAAAMVRVADRIEPNEENIGRYNCLYSLYGQLYPALRPILHRLHAGQVASKDIYD